MNPILLSKSSHFVKDYGKIRDNFTFFLNTIINKSVNYKILLGTVENFLDLCRRTCKDKQSSTRTLKTRLKSAKRRRDQKFI